MAVSQEILGNRLRVAFDLFEAGCDIMQQNLRRKYPKESDDQIQLRLAEWLSTRPGAEFGDCDGRTFRLGERS